MYDEHRNEKVWKLVAAARPDDLARIEEDYVRITGEFNAMREKRLDAETPYQDRRDALAKILSRRFEARHFPVTLPAGSEMTVDRLYVRKGISEYSSVTFYLTKTEDAVLGVRGKRRFWARLAEVNRLEFDLLDG